ncbi:glycoside hydrolase family 2 TIM barrel-domain containing protein [Ohessyouella blattaphilus]|uniref:glycoside hydrolase family 2 protein n=1 Tax=Ohessyouella blattaphilus TaxID=2949333 RepID=UPI003EB8A210
MTLPHTWNALDGQDGGGDYYQGIGWYRKNFRLESDWKQVYIRFGAVSKMAKVICNGQPVGEHRGGFSAFTLDLSPYLHDGENEILVCADNSLDLPIYPRNADFTFFGGIYRDVQLICFDQAEHFDVMTFGTDSLFVTADPEGQVSVCTYVPDGERVTVSILDGDRNIVASRETVGTDGKAQIDLTVDHPKLWNGLDAPELYTCTASMAADCISTSFGFRSFSVSPEEGFFLNGRNYPLHGVCRHQDRENLGWALSEKEHTEDMELIREIGANTLRLAHYQQAPFFYDLCDSNGIVVWAEIPFISVYDDCREADDNLRQQLMELIMQNYNHPAICFWGIANELGIGGESENMIEMLTELNTLAKRLDSTRLTTIANVGMTMPESAQFHITDLASYNEYMGWYEGTPDDHGIFCDERHARMPEVPIAISEYGADSILSWHSAQPVCKDYTEEYQAIVHEKAYAEFEKRPYLWATWLWNMFDFAADARDEGGCKGRNNKGIVTYDRKIKKDAFYFYKSKWSKEPFAYICGKRFTRRHEDQIEIKVYSNASRVTLTVNGHSMDTKTGNAVFCFENVPLLEDTNVVEVLADNKASDSLVLEKVLEKPQEYTYVVQKNVSSNVAQWFAGQDVAVKELLIREGFLSVEDPLEIVYQYPDGERAVKETIQKPLSTDHPAMAARMDTGGAMSFASIWNHISKMLPDEAIYLLNERLNKIPK